MNLKHTILLTITLLFLGCSQNQDFVDTESLSVDKTETSDPLSEYHTLSGMTYGKGSGLGGTFITFHSENVYDIFSFCDICPGGYQFGNYIETEKWIIIEDTLCYSTQPHFAAPKDTVFCEELYIDTLYKWIQGDSILLADTIQYDRTLLPKRKVYFWTRRYNE